MERVLGNITESESVNDNGNNFFFLLFVFT